MVAMNLSRLIRLFFSYAMILKIVYALNLFFFGRKNILSHLLLCQSWKGLTASRKDACCCIVVSLSSSNAPWRGFNDQEVITIFRYGVCFVLFINCIHYYSYLPAIFYLRLLLSKITRCTYLQFNHDIHFEFGKISNTQVASLLWALTDSNIKNKFNWLFIKLWLKSNKQKWLI